jgi:hypothetical protein
MRRSSASTNSSIAISLSSSSGRSRHYFDLSTVMNLGLGPDTTTNHLAVQRHGDATRVNAPALQELQYSLIDEYFVVTIDAYHVRLRAKSMASSEVSAASVTPWR